MSAIYFQVTCVILLTKKLYIYIYTLIVQITVIVW